jgi:hypothetical protein
LHVREIYARENWGGENRPPGGGVVNSGGVDRCELDAASSGRVCGLERTRRHAGVPRLTAEDFPLARGRAWPILSPRTRVSEKLAHI